MKPVAHIQRKEFLNLLSNQCSLVVIFNIVFKHCILSFTCLDLLLCHHMSVQVVGCSTYLLVWIFYF